MSLVAVAILTATGGVPAFEARPGLRVAGVLLDRATGDPMTGSAAVGLRLYADQVGSTPLFDETQVIDLDQGAFSLEIEGSLQDSEGEQRWFELLAGGVAGGPRGPFTGISGDLGTFLELLSFSRPGPSDPIVIGARLPPEGYTDVEVIPVITDQNGSERFQGRHQPPRFRLMDRSP